LTNDVEDLYHRLGTNLLTLGKTEDEQRAKIREIIIRNVALSNANVAAVAFQRDVVAKDPPQADNLNAVAKEKGLEVKVTKPFDKEYGPGELELPSKYPASELFNLTAEEPFVDTPVAGQDGVYILAFNKFIPSHVPALDDIRSRVIADCRFLQAQRIAQANGRTFAVTLTNGLAAGRTFAAICAEAKMKPVEVPPFSESTQTLPQVESDMDLTTFKEIALNTPAGKASGFMPTHAGGAIVYVRERLPLDPAKMKADLPDFSKAVRQERESDAFQLWFSREASPALRDIPAFQQQGKS
jgi:hypothetical protein